MAFLNVLTASSRQLKDIPSPHKLAVCILIKIYQDILQDQAEFELDEITTARYVSLIHSLVRGSDHAEEMPFSSLVSRVEETVGVLVGGKHISAQLKAMLDECSESPDELMNLVGDFELFLRNGKSGDNVSTPSVSWSSSFGMFIRKFLFAIKLGGFSMITRIYDEVLSYVEGNSLTLSHSLDDAELHSVSSGLSPRQLQLFLHKLALELEKKVGEVPFEQLDSEIEALLKLQPDLPQAYFVRSLNCALHGDFCGALKNHHHYFDHASRFASVGSTDIFSRNKESVDRIGMRIQMHIAQHAELVKARLHFQFGQYESAACSIEETFRLAQDHANKDTITLALAWQYQVMLSQHQSKAINTLRRCLNSCANQTKQCEVEATAKLNLARSLSLNPSLSRADVSREVTSDGASSLLSARAQVWEALSWVSSSSPDVIAIDLNSISNASTNPNPTDHHVSALLSSQSDTLQATAELVAAGVFAAGGHGRLHFLSSLHMLMTSNGSSSDVATAMSNIAKYQMQYSKPSSSSKDASKLSSGLKEALSSLLEIKKKYPTSAMAGQWLKPGASLLLKHQLSLKNHSNKMLFSLTTCLLLSDSVSPCRRFVSPSSSSFIASYLPFHDTDPNSRCDSSESPQSKKIEVCDSGGDVNAPFDQDHYNALVNQIIVYVTHRRFAAALKLTMILQAACRDRKLYVCMGDLLLLECRIRQIASPCHPCSVITCIMRCLALTGGPSENKQSTYVHSSQHAQALLELALFYFTLDEPVHASALLEGVMPKIMEHAPVISKGRARLLLAKCYLKHLSKLTSKVKVALLDKVIRTLCSAKLYLECAMGELGGVEALCEVYYLLARCYGSHPLQSQKTLMQRDAYSKLFIDTKGGPV